MNSQLHTLFVTEDIGRRTQDAAATNERPSRVQRFREHRRDRKQRRAWRRERRKGVMNLYDATNQAESSQYRGGFFKKD